LILKHIKQKITAIALLTPPQKKWAPTKGAPSQGGDEQDAETALAARGLAATRIQLTRPARESFPAAKNFFLRCGRVSAVRIIAAIPI
jgi:hypothetical protein